MSPNPSFPIAACAPLKQAAAASTALSLTSLSHVSSLSPTLSPLTAPCSLSRARSPACASTRASRAPPCASRAQAPTDRAPALRASERDAGRPRHHGRAARTAMAEQASPATPRAKDSVPDQAVVPFCFPINGLHASEILSSPHSSPLKP